MVKQEQNEGYTVFEMLLLFLMISLVVWNTPRLSIPSVEIHYQVADYWRYQAKAISNGEDQIFRIGRDVVYFNDRGNVRQAQRIFISGKEFISHLGGGRLEKK